MPKNVAVWDAAGDNEALSAAARVHGHPRSTASTKRGFYVRHTTPSWKEIQVFFFSGSRLSPFKNSL